MDSKKPSPVWRRGILKRSLRTRENFVGPMGGLFCCLMGNSLKPEAVKETYVFTANDPVYSTILHNRCQVSIKDTRNIAPFWHLLLVLGPFPKLKEARECARQWVNRTRGCISKIKKGLELAMDYQVRCYSRYETPAGGTLSFLRRCAPRCYVRTYQLLVANGLE